MTEYEITLSPGTPVEGCDPGVHGTPIPNVDAFIQHRHRNGLRGTTAVISPVTVYDAYTMRRTQIYLDERQLARLRSEARATRRTVSDIIRSAIDESLDRPDQSDRFEEALASVAGIWAGRPDVGDTDEYVRKLRRDRRGSHLR